LNVDAGESRVAHSFGSLRQTVPLLASRMTTHVCADSCANPALSNAATDSAVIMASAIKWPLTLDDLSAG
jgi:hypothetical protein